MPDFDYSSQTKALRECGRQILELGNSGVTRAFFLESVLQRITNSVGCDTARTVLRDRGRRSYVEYDRNEPGNLILDVQRDADPAGSLQTWSAGPNPGMEETCRRLVQSQCDTTLPWFTESGSLCISNVSGFPNWDDWRKAQGTSNGLVLSAGCLSLLIVPIHGIGKCLGLVQLESKRPGFFEPRLAERVEPLIQTFGIAAELRNLQVALRERVKELTCLYGIARLVARAELSLDEVLQNSVEILPPGWLYPEIAAAKIILDGRSFVTFQANRMAQSMSSDIFVQGRLRGSLTVGYIEERPTIDEGPFLLEERHLIDTIARELSFVIEQKSHAEERERLQIQLRHADRLATIGQLAAGVAHELNEPLSTVMGFAQLASKQAGIPESAIRDMNKIVTASLHARKIIKELLVFAREAKPMKVTFNLNSLIRDGLFFLESRFDKAGINLVCELDDNLPAITADRSQILQVLTNLVVNSVQAMPNGGRLTIRTFCTEDQVQLVVEDTGCGMDAATMTNIFHPFYSTKDVDAGTGLGLSVVHGIIASHDGSVEVNSQSGEGSRFCIRLPLHSAKTKSEDPAVD